MFIETRTIVVALTTCLSIPSLHGGQPPAEPAAAAPDARGIVTIDDGNPYKTSVFEIEYENVPRRPTQIEIGDLLRTVEFDLLKTDEGYVSPRKQIPGARFRFLEIAEGYVVAGTSETSAAGPRPEVFKKSALDVIQLSIVAEFRKRGQAVVLVWVDFDDVDAKGADIRQPPRKDRVLRFRIRTGQVSVVRTLAFGERIPDNRRPDSLYKLLRLAFGTIPDERRIDHPWHEAIKDGSPIQPGNEFSKDKIDQYVYMLSRHPGRRVDVALSPDTSPARPEREAGGKKEAAPPPAEKKEPGAHPAEKKEAAPPPAEKKEPGPPPAEEKPADDKIGLDYLVTESEPFFVFGQVSNTGTKATNEWRERFGLVHNQLTRHDDVLNLNYITSGFEQVHAFLGSYEAPTFIARRLRWQVYGSWSQFDASNVGIFDESFSGNEWSAGGQLIANVYQQKDFFVDLFAGPRWQNIEVRGIVQGQDDFFLPRAGARFEKVTDTYLLAGTADVEGNMSSVANTDARKLDSLGRLKAEDDFVAMHWSLTPSFYLDPIIFGKQWEYTTKKDEKDEKDKGGKHSTLAHEIALSFEGQHSFGDRLIPQYERTAGGFYTVRGYPESVVAGDTVLIARAEYLFHLARALPRSEPSVIPVFGDFRWTPQQPYGRADWDLIFRTFFDAGQTYNAFKQSYERDDLLLGTGFGFEFLFRRNISARFDWGIALTDVKGAGITVNDGENRFHLIFTILY